MLIDTRNSPHAKVYSLPQGNVRWRAGFWLDRFNTCFLVKEIKTHQEMILC